MLEILMNILECKSAYECIQKVKALICDYEALKLDSIKLIDESNYFELEKKAARETILRLTGELNKANLDRETVDLEMRQLKKALDSGRQAQKDAALSNQDLQERVRYLTSALERAHLEAERREARFRRLTEASTAAASRIANAEPLISTSEHKALQDFLHFTQHQLKSSEDQSVESLLSRIKDHIIDRDEELKLMKTELSDSESKAQEYLKKAASLSLVENEKKNLERDLSKMESSNRSLKNEISNYRNWISSLVDQLKLEDVDNEKEYPILMDAISARIKRIVYNEREKTAGQRSRLSQFQQKNQELRERNDALETQLGVLRRRLTEMEGEETETRRNLRTATSLDRDRRKLAKQLEQSRAEVSTLQSENGRLRNELLSASQSSLAAVGTNALLHSAETRIRELREKCDSLGKELRVLRFEKNQNDTAMEGKINEFQRKIESLEVDLDRVRRSESQLLGFREVVARLLNLDCDELGVPDFEIIHRLEHIVLALDAPDIQKLHKNCLTKSL
ncbi:hypothetical protein Aperf_G00000025264 [Anoplocephala perfoliata]